MSANVPKLVSRAALAAGVATAVARRSRSAVGSPRDHDRETAVQQLGASPTEHRIDVPDGEVHVVEWGEGQPFLLIHGYTATHGDWLPVIPGLVEAGYRVVAMDLPGHGQSRGGVNQTMDVWRLAQDARAVIEQLDLREAVLAGHSLGGLIIMALAAQDPTFATERIRHLVTVGSSPMMRGVAELATLAFGVNPSGPLLLRNRFTGRAQMQLTVFGPDADRQVIDDARVRWATCPIPVRWTYAAGTLGNDLRPHLPDIPVPITAVVGSLDRVCPPGRGQIIADQAPQGEVRVLDGAGHMMPAERTQELTQILLRAAA